jgi:hypothetical protein
MYWPLVDLNCSLFLLDFSCSSLTYLPVFTCANLLNLNYFTLSMHSPTHYTFHSSFCFSLMPTFYLDLPEPINTSSLRHYYARLVMHTTCSLLGLYQLDLSLASHLYSTNYNCPLCTTYFNEYLRTIGHNPISRLPPYHSHQQHISA